MRVKKTAFITGITGQDGSILARFLLEKGYNVHGMRPYAACVDTQRLADILSHTDFHLHHGDLTDAGNLCRLLAAIKPSEIYNLGAMSHVKESFSAPEAAANINGLGTLRLLEAIRTLGMGKSVRFYQASSSEMFGNAPAPQNEETPFAPCSPYACAKLYAYWTVRTYRDAYGLHASNGILFNHESPVRGELFVTRKITQSVAAIVLGQQTRLSLGNLSARRDWGHARDYVEGMWLMLQQDLPGDYVLATGQAFSVREFALAAFAEAGIELVFTGEGLEEKGVCMRAGRVLVDVDPLFFRPAELHSLIGDASKARKILGWKPRTDFRTLVGEMVKSDLETLTQKGHFEDDERFLFAAE